jgi:hypothetical protein
VCVVRCVVLRHLLACLFSCYYPIHLLLAFHSLSTHHHSLTNHAFTHHPHHHSLTNHAFTHHPHHHSLTNHAFRTLCRPSSCKPSCSPFLRLLPPLILTLSHTFILPNASLEPPLDRVRALLHALLPFTSHSPITHPSITSHPPLTTPLSLPHTHTHINLESPIDRVRALPHGQGGPPAVRWRG